MYHKEVELFRDVPETDKYSRLLRYVVVDGILVNDELVIQGAARPAIGSRIPPAGPHWKKLNSKYRSLVLASGGTSDERRVMADVITDIVIVRRTFEGKIDPSKNDDSLTSKYMPSHKVAVVYMKNGKRAVETFATKSEARQWVDRIGYKNG